MKNTANFDRPAMPASDSNSSSTLGYLTYVRIPNLGIVGGYLLVNERARPIEFHCTAPIQSTRAQQILYGRTLRSALLCDRIGKALIDQSAKRVDLLLTDVADAFGLRQVTNTPIALFASDVSADGPTLKLFDESDSDSDSEDGKLEQDEAGSETDTSEMDTGEMDTSEMDTSEMDTSEMGSEWSFEFAGYSFTSPPDFPDDRERVRETLLGVTRDWDLAEPLERIRAAIQEAQRAAA